MALPILICDDSSFARKAIARSLPDEWDVEISFAEHGKQAIEKIEQGLAHVLFLDLNMPIMDGYETMKVIRQRDLPTMVIVVSGDVQEEARKRVIEMGALDFIEKPIDNTKLFAILSKFGIYDGQSSSNQRQCSIKTGNSLEEKLDVFREMSNVAMGQAGNSLAKLLNIFVELPVPNVSIIHSNEIAMAIAEIDKNDAVSGVSKGFTSKNLRGEAVILFNDTHAKSLSALLNPEESNSEGYNTDERKENHSELEALMDVSNIIVGACLRGLAKQLDVDVTHTTPSILGLHCELSELVEKNVSRWEELILVEIAYSMPSVSINFELLLLLPVDSLDLAFERFLSVREK